MQLKNNYFYTIREDIKDEDSVSSNLLVRSGMIKKMASGIYIYLPLGYKVLKNIEGIIREEMNKIGAQELLMSNLVHEDIYKSSGRFNHFGSSIFKLKDRYDKQYVLGPTHEELFAIAGTMKVKSYKDLPFNLYQFQTKFRDEPRPRYGLIRLREFIMKDAYSFDKDYDGLDLSYQKMFNAYKMAFDRMNINYKVVKADTGVMGGLLSEEFQAITDIGEDDLVLCNNCDYASNIEVSECITKEIKNNDDYNELKELYTPNIGKIKDLIDNYNVDINKMTKSIVYKIDNEYVLVMVSANDDINEIKLQKLFNANYVILANESEVKEITKAEVGFAGPIGLNIKIVADNAIKNMTNFLIGSNKTDYHFMNANYNRDFKVDMWADVRMIKEGDICPKCGSSVYFKKGIEIGNTFKLGIKYSEVIGLNYLDNNNNLNPVVMGSYGIGLGRCMAAIVEQHNDEKGIIWPLNIAPYKVGIILISNENNKQLEVSNFIYEELKKFNIEVILDNRDERPGVKFNDMDLIGIPIRLTIGKKVIEEIVELKLRDKDEIYELNKDDVINKIKELIKISSN